MELTNIGVVHKTNDPMSVPLATSSPKEGVEVTGTSHESTELDNHEKQDSTGYNILRKNTNTIYPHNGTTKRRAGTGKQKSQTTVEWWENLDKDSRALMLALVFILILSLTSLVLVVLDVVGVVGPKCVHNSKLENTKQNNNFIRPNESTTFLLERIDVLENNISSLVLQIRSLQSGGNGVSQGNITDSGSGANGGKDYPSNSSRLTSEVQKLREKQVQLNSSLTKLKENDKTKTKDIQEMKAKVVGLAVAVNFLSLNDSLINSKVHKLGQSEVEFRSSIEALRQKDAAVDATLERAKGVEAFLNSSVNQLNIRLDQMNTNIMAKIKSMNGTIRGMQGGGAGLPGPPGPPGPRGIPGTPGAGNLSQCQHQQKTIQGTSSSSADFFANYVEPKHKIVVGASCSTVRGDEASLSSVTNSRGEKVYLCTCRGASNYARGSGNMKCLIDVWVCPRIS